MSSFVMASPANTNSTMPPMNVMYPLTPMRVEMPGSMPLMEAWKKAAPPTEPVTFTHDPTDPYMSAMPLTMRSRMPRLTVAGADLGFVNADWG